MPYIWPAFSSKRRINSMSSVVAEQDLGIDARLRGLALGSGPAGLARRLWQTPFWSP